MELAAQAAEGKRAAASEAALRAQLAALCSSVGVDEAEAGQGAPSEQMLAAVCLWITKVRRFSICRNSGGRLPSRCMVPCPPGILGLPSDNNLPGERVCA